MSGPDSTPVPASSSTAVPESSSTAVPASSSTPVATAGVTYICVAAVEDQRESEDNPVCVVCHYNDGHLERHIMKDVQDTFDYHGYVYDSSGPLPDYSKPAVITGENWTTKIEGNYCEAFLRPDPAQSSINPYSIFVRFMINPEASELLRNPAQGTGFPVGWAVRGYLPEELARRNREWQLKNPEWRLKNPKEQLKNEMNVLPVFRADFEHLVAKCPKGYGDRIGDLRLRRAYYITNQPQYQLLKPKSLKAQIKEAGPGPSRESDNPDDIAKAHMDVQVRES